MNKYKKIGISIGILFVIAIVAIVASANMPNNVKNKEFSEISPVTPILRYTKMCCIQDTYYVDWYTGEDYFQVPIIIEVWNKTLVPVKNVKVRVQVFNETSGKRFDQTKYTNSNGLARFGYYEIYPYGPHQLKNPNWDWSPRKIEVWIEGVNGGTTYMEKKFKILAD